MRFVNSGQTFSVNYTAYDQADSLNVAFNIYDVTTGSAVFISQVDAVYANFGVYTADYVPQSNKTYLIIGLVYTDNTFTTVDTTRAPSADVVQVLQSSISSLGFAYASYDQSSSLNIKASVYNLNSGSPVLVTTRSMTHVLSGVYYGSYSGSLDHSYQIASVVYTDNTFTTPDPNYSPSTDSFDTFSIGILISSPAQLTSNGSAFSSTLLPPIHLTQGDDAELELTAVDGNGNPVNISGATLVSYINGANGAGVMAFGNSNHTINADQLNNTGQYTLTLSETETASLGLGNHKEILTTITIGGTIVYFRGSNILQVYPPVPLE